MGLFEVFINQTLLVSFADYDQQLSCREVCSESNTEILQYKHLKGKDYKKRLRSGEDYCLKNLEKV